MILRLQGHAGFLSAWLAHGAPYQSPRERYELLQQEMLGAQPRLRPDAQTRAASVTNARARGRKG